MLELTGSFRSLCSGLTRRQMIQVGTLGVFGLSLSDLLRFESQASGSAKSASKRSVILIWQHGGPSQLDTFDMKPEAPSEYRGPYQSIDSSLPGLPVCEKLPYHAKIMHLSTVIRSFSHENGDHWAAAHWMLTGRTGANGSDRVPRHPSMAAVSSQLLGPRLPGALPYVNMNDGGFGFHGGAWLGVSQNPFQTGTYSYGNEAGRLPAGNTESLKLVDGLTRDRLADRKQLLSGFDRIRHSYDRNGVFESMDRIDQQATEIVLSGRTREAFDLSVESQATRDFYGPGWGEQALLARRLIEAGARFVTLNTGYWDDHGQIEKNLNRKLPMHDQAVGALIADLHDRGMLDDTLVITAGEFGRTPRINGDAGRDHWPQAQSILLAGGGYRHGQVIGATDSKAEFPISRKIGVEDFCAIIYHVLGFRPEDVIYDRAKRPMHLLPGGEVPYELLG